MRYADVILDHKSRKMDSLFTYACPFDEVREGQKVTVPFGEGDRLHDAYVFRIQEELPEGNFRTLKTIESWDPEICLTQEMLETVSFMTRRYLCRTIEAVKCFVPAGSALKNGKHRNPPYAQKSGETSPVENLTEEQQRAVWEILPALQRKQHELFLLHGVTGSGKTEVYMRLAEICLNQGRTVIMLVPEISLTGQIIERFFGRFGAENIAVLHSRLGSGARYDEWQRIRRGDARIVIGARSAVFAPLTEIGLVILDEEHESAYKPDSAPKYETVEIAIKRAKAFGGAVLAASATPSVATYERAREEIYHKITMKERYNKVALPKMETVDMRREFAKGNRTVFSGKLYHGIQDALGSGKQVILLLNRRGYSTSLSCRNCGFVMRCPECGISMVYHKEENAAVCHYCGRRRPIPLTCPECGSRYIRHFGTGTEKLEEESRKFFPQASIARLDLDTTRRKGSIERILSAFQKGKTNLLIGTQMVAKGLDFRNVSLVGILAADLTLNIPDFRSAEKTFQLITQAAGRAGRGDEQGRVIIQTYAPEHYAVRAAAAQDYEAFYRTEIRIRKMLGYPPYSDLIQIVVSASAEAVAEQGAERVERMLRESLGKRGGDLLGRKPAPIGKLSGKYRYHLFLKCPRGRRAEDTMRIAAVQQQLLDDPKNKCTISIDINPYSFL